MSRSSVPASSPTYYHLYAPDSDLALATRASTTEPFGTPALVEELNVGAQSGDPHLSADGKTMTFAVKDPGTDWDLYMATRACLP